MSMLEIFGSDDYSDGRTKQAFKDSTDINKLLAKAAQGDTITHLAKYGAVYADFSDIDDLLTSFERLQIGEKIFAALPGEVRREFDQSPGEFFRFVNDPENIERLPELIPGLAKPGNQLEMKSTVPKEPGKIEIPLGTPAGPPAAIPVEPTPGPPE